MNSFKNGATEIYSIGLKVQLGQFQISAHSKKKKKKKRKKEKITTKIINSLRLRHRQGVNHEIYLTNRHHFQRTSDISVRCSAVTVMNGRRNADIICERVAVLHGRFVPPNFPSSKFEGVCVGVGWGRERKQVIS